MPTPDYSAIYAVVRNKLQKTKEALPDDDEAMVAEAVFVVPMLVAKISCLNGDYGALSAGDKLLFDGAAGRIIAARLRPVLLAGENNGKGTLIETQFGDERRRYAAYNGNQSGSKTSLEETWATEAQEALAAMSCVVNRVKRSGASFVGLAGRRRRDEKNQGFHTIDVRDLMIASFGVLEG